MVPRCSIVAALVVCAIAIHAPILSAKECPQFPQDAELWIKSSPLNVLQLRGKSGVLCFLDASVDLRLSIAIWQGFNSDHQEAIDEKKPFTFIAVVSGRSPEDVLAYANTVEASFSIIADVDRSFERACGVEEITRKHNREIVVISTAGELQPMSAEQFATFFINSEVDAASWKIPPADIPGTLHEVWRKVELGSFDGVAIALKRARVSKKSDVENAAKKLQELVQAAIDNELDAAKVARDNNEPWKAYEICRMTSERFNVFQLPAELNEIKKELAKLPEVKRGTAGWKVIETSRKNLKEGRSVSRSVVAQLEKIVADVPETDLSRAASRVLDKVKQSQ